MVEVKYKCKCQTDEQTLFILARNSNEEILHYMNYMQQQIGAHHADYGSKKCRNTTMEYAKIYVTPEGVIGGQETIQ